MKSIFIFQDIDGNECSVYANAEARGHSITLFEVDGIWVVDGTKFKRTHFDSAEVANLIFENQRLVEVAKRFGAYQTSFE